VSPETSPESASIVRSPAASGGDQRVDTALRPRRFSDFVGQEKIKDNLMVMTEAAKARQEPIDHVLLCGPPGLGKTSLAYIIAAEMDSAVHVNSGPAIEKKGDLAGILTNLQPNDVLFIDEIHRLSPAVEEYLYPAMEDFRIDVVLGDGPHARTHPIPLSRFTLIGATTRSGLLSSPMRDRFGYVGRVDFYSADELVIVLNRSAKLLGVPLDSDGATEIARRSRGTPRIANRLLRRVRDFAQLETDGHISLDLASSALSRLDIDELGFDDMDRKLLLTIIDRFGGGPVGLDTISAAVGEDASTIESVVEPFLIKEGYLSRTPRGRVATESAFAHFERTMKQDSLL
jgi:Holliday junction DNA helicase RuvB